MRNPIQIQKSKCKNKNDNPKLKITTQCNREPQVTISFWILLCHFAF